MALDVNASILDPLNDAQRAAVTADPRQHTLVVSGAGTGKTRVLTHRFAWLVIEGHAQAHEIIAVTFTNKAAKEMSERIEELLGRPARGLWIGTYHSLCRRMLKEFPNEATLPRDHSILDSDDQKKLLRETLSSLHRPHKPADVQFHRNWISRQKTHGLRAKHIEPQTPQEADMNLPVYVAYEKRCQTGNVVDFDELLLRALELIREHPDVCAHYQKRFKYLLADEFQDTSDLQYSWLSILSGRTKLPIYVVGDGDQSIYSWRGARPQIMDEFEDSFHPIKTPLNQNYRSTTAILEVANSLIQNNTQRRAKKGLWTQRPGSAQVGLDLLDDEVQEARFAIDLIRRYAEEEDHSFSDCAILYRTNRQAQPFESTLYNAGVPYRIYGGHRFFDHTEIKDALAYLQLSLNPDNDVAWLRVCNQPPRGLGNTTVKKIKAHAGQQEGSLSVAAQSYCRTHNDRVATALTRFEQLIAHVRSQCTEGSLVDAVKAVLEDTGLLARYQEQDQKRDEERSLTLGELANAAAEFEEQFIPEDDPTQTVTEAFLERAALQAGELAEGPAGDAVQLMTLHAVKGLEFPLVVLPGVEEGLLPLIRADESQQMGEEELGDRTEEERRLMYVGLTRAQQRLHLTCVQWRRVYGRSQSAEPSGFLDELPGAYLSQQVPTRPIGAGPYKTHAEIPSLAQYGKAPSTPLPADVPQLGTPVQHPKFGDGTILKYEGNVSNLRVQVAFKTAGTKWLIYEHARLNPQPHLPT